MNRFFAEGPYEHASVETASMRGRPIAPEAAARLAELRTTRDWVWLGRRREDLTYSGGAPVAPPTDAPAGVELPGQERLSIGERPDGEGRDR